MNCKITITIYAVEEPNDSNVVVGDKGFRLVNSGERLSCRASLLLQPGDDGVGGTATAVLQGLAVAEELQGGVAADLEKNIAIVSLSGLLLPYKLANPQKFFS